MLIMKIEGREICDHSTTELLKHRKLYIFMLSLSVLLFSAGIVFLFFGEELISIAAILFAFGGLMMLAFVTFLRGINAELKKRKISEVHRASEKKFSKRLWIIVGIFILVILVFSLLSPHLVQKNHNDYESPSTGYWGADGYYNPSDKEMKEAWDEANKWMQENW